MVRPPRDEAPGWLTTDPQGFAPAVSGRTDNPEGSWPAEDAGALLTEAARCINSADLVVLDAMDGGNYSLCDALAFVLTVHGKVRRFIAAAVVEATA